MVRGSSSRKNICMCRSSFPVGDPRSMGAFPSMSSFRGMGFQFTHDAIGEPSERSDGRSVVERNSLRSSSLVLSALSRNTFASPLYGWSKASSIGT